MPCRHPFRLCISLVATLSLAVFTIHLAGAPQAARQASPKKRFLVVARTPADVDALRAEVATAGGTVVRDLSQITLWRFLGPTRFASASAPAPSPAAWPRTTSSG